MSKVYKVIHKKSNVVNDGAPKLPQASTLEYGEIAINYGVSGETLSIKNSADQIVTFPSRDIIDRMVEGKGYLTGYTETDPTVPSWAKAESKPSYTASEVGAMATSERGNYLTTATTIPSIAGLVASVDYDSTGKTIVFYDSSDNVVDSIDATDFIKDGMVDSVAIATPTGGTNSGITCLVVTFNTDAGKEDIEIPLSNIFNPANYYNKTQADQTFLSQSAYTEDEEVIASALNDLNDRIENFHVPSYTSELNNDSGFITSAYTGFSSTGHTHSQYSTTAHTHTAAEVGAMATSERSNYLATGTTLDSIADGTTRKLSDYLTTATTIPTDSGLVHKTGEEVIGQYAVKTIYDSMLIFSGETDDTGAEFAENSFIKKIGYGNGEPNGLFDFIQSFDAQADADVTLQEVLDSKITSAYTGFSPTGHTHSEYSTTGHTHTAAEVGAMATSERGNYLTTATTIPTTAAEVGAMATSERSNYLATGTTLDSIADGSTRKLSDYSLTSHTHSEYATTADTANFITSADTKVQVYGITASTLNGSNVKTALEGTNFETTIFDVLGNGGLPVIRIRTGSSLRDFLFVNGNYSNLFQFVSIDKAASQSFPDTNTEITLLDISFDAYEASGSGSMGADITSCDIRTSVVPNMASDIDAMDISERGNYLTTATTIPTTAAEVGAMATSERSNYLTTATTIPTESTISSSGFTKNGITGINVNGTASTVTNGVADITIPSGLPAVTATDNGKILQVVNGAWTLVTPTTVYTGTDVPLSSVGNDGDIYLQTS